MFGRTGGEFVISPLRLPAEKEGERKFLSHPHTSAKRGNNKISARRTKGRGEKEAEASREPAEYKVGTDERDQI